MKSYDESDESDVKDAAEIRAEPWMLDMLKRNPDYVGWGPGDDCMNGAGRDGGWSGGVDVATWANFEWQLDDLNACVNFYFYVGRDSVLCATCKGDGLNIETRAISLDFYGVLGLPGWHDNITQDEVDALVEAGRLLDLTSTWARETGWVRDPSKRPTAEQVNELQHGRGFGHDAINRWILVETRAKRLGVWGHCAECSGKGHIYKSETARCGLILWIIHPRKGASRGVDVKSLRQEDVPAVLAWLREAAKQNTERFAGALRD